MITRATGLVGTYEQLRAAVLSAQPIAGSGLVTMRRQGMVAWIKAASATPELTPPCPPSEGAIASSELTLILASLVVSLTAEPAHA